MSKVDTVEVTGTVGNIQKSKRYTNLTEGTIPVGMHLGFKLGQPGTYSTMELHAIFNSHHRPEDMDHRAELYKRDMKMALQIMDEMAGELNAARGALGQHTPWVPSGGGPSGLQPTSGQIPAEGVAEIFTPAPSPPNTFQPPPTGGGTPPPSFVPPPAKASWP